MSRHSLFYISFHIYRAQIKVNLVIAAQKFYTTKKVAVIGALTPIPAKNRPTGTRAMPGEQTEAVTEVMRSAGSTTC